MIDEIELQEWEELAQKPTHNGLGASFIPNEAVLRLIAEVRSLRKLLNELEGDSRPYPPKR
jgi:hypothetical protein